MMNPTIGEGKAESVDIKEYIAILLKRKWLILVCFLLSMAGTTAFLFTRQPIYRAQAKMLVTMAGGAVPQTEITREEEGTYYGTQVNIMLSQTMLRRLQQRMKKTPEEITENLVRYTVSRMWGSNILLITVDSPSQDFARDFANAMAEEYLRVREEQRAQSSESALLMLTREINRLSQELKAGNEKYVNFIRENNLVGVEQLQVKEQEQMLAQYGLASIQLADAQTRKELIESRRDAASALAILTADTGLGRAEQSKEGDSTGLISDGATAETDADGNLKLAAEGARARGDQKTEGGLELAASELSSEQPGIGLTGVNRGALWAVTESRAQRLFDLQKARKSLEARLAQLSAVYLPRHWAIVDTENKLASVIEQINAEVQMVREKADADLKFAQARFDRSKTVLDSMSERSFQERNRGLEQRAITDEIERVKSLYNALIGKLLQIDVTQNFNTRTVSIMEYAIVDADPVYPKKMKGLLVAALFGLGLGLALAFFIEYIDDSIKLAEEVERDLQLPFLGMIPAAQWNPDDLSAHRLDRLKQQGGVAESYRVVRSAIIFSIPREKLRSILMTSAVPREGKTTSCVNLSIGFAQIEERVLLIDADLRRGEIHKYFGMEKDKGLTDVLLGEATPEEVVRHTDVPKLDVITVGAYPANPAELLLGWRLKELLEWAYKHYDRIIIDCTPVMGIADSAILGSAVDGVLFIIWAGRTSRRYVRVAKMTAVSRGAKVFGFVLNNLEPGRVGYYHYYPYYYSYYSRGYYYAHKEEEDAGKGGDIKGIEVPSPKEGKDEIDDVY